MSEALLISQDTRGVVTLTLNRPEVRNAFDDALIVALISALKNIAEDRQARLVHLRGAGKIFCAGADLPWMHRMANYSYQENLADAEKLAELMTQLNSLPQPTIAFIQGAAYGGGIGLAACCDMAIATTQTTFCFSEVKLGLIPAVISPFVLSRMGEKAMRRYALTAEVFDALQAKSMGLIDEVVAENELEAVAEKMTEMILLNAPEAMTEMKILLQKISSGLSQEEVRKATIKAIAERRMSTEGQARLKTFLERNVYAKTKTT